MMLLHNRKRFFQTITESPSKMARKRAFNNGVSHRVFGQSQKTSLRAGLYARISTHDQQTLSLQRRAMRDYADRRGWAIAIDVKEVGSGASVRELRQKLLDAARRRDIDVVIVWAARYCTSQKSCADSCLCTAAAGLLFPC